MGFEEPEDSLFGEEQRAIDEKISKAVYYLIEEGYKKTDILLCLSCIIAEIIAETQSDCPDI